MGKRRPATPLASKVRETLYGATVRAELDLHGLRAEQAIQRVELFVDTWSRREPDAVLRIITGKGNRSAGAPVLLEAVREWLRQESGDKVADMVRDAGGGGWLVRVGGPRNSS